MMAGVAIDDNVAFAILLYSYIIASRQTSYNPNHEGPGELQSGSSGCDHGSEGRGEIYGHENS